MRKWQQKQITELLRTIKQAQSEGLYATAQEGALNVGNFIESIEGEGTKTVDLLVEYCEMLYKASIGEIGEKALAKKLAKIENSAWSELNPNKIEIVFLSYNASMSDAIESIYLAAKADPVCDAYWVPIPYFERKSDGSLGTMHYEGAECYGDHIECIDWQKYDIEARHPDVIFTFAPYDAGNYVTMVHPYFFCERLRALTDMLVYCPYFVSVDDNAPDHLAMIAGSVFAHKVILQSKKICDDYLRIFNEKFGNRYGRSKDKFLALGSPKFDKVINTKRENCIIPDEWKCLVDKKKVIFFNTTIAAVLQSNEQYMKKLRHVFDIFRSRDDVVLWWRPHPLMMSTLISMRPGLVEEYQKIVKEYQDENLGVYDESANLNTAIAWSDAYYGDMSSVVALFAVSGKPVVVANNKESYYKSTSNSIFFANQYDDGTYLWFIEFNANVLFKMDKQSWKADYVCALSEFTSYGAPAFSGIVECDGALYFAPSYADHIGKYDLTTGIFDKLAIRDFNGPRNHKFHTICAYNKNVYLFGVSYPAIIKLDTDTGRMTYISEWTMPIKRLKVNDDNLWFGACQICGNNVVLPAQSANAVVIFNMDTCTSKIVEIPSKNKGYDDVCFDGEYYWFAARHSGGTIVKWHPEKGVFEVPIPNGWADGSYWAVCYANGYVWYIPSLGGTAFKLNAATDEVEIAEPFMPECRLRNEKGNQQTANYYMACAEGDGIIYAHTGMSNTHIAYNAITEERREETITASTEDRKKLANDIVLNHCENSLLRTMRDCLFREFPAFTVNDFLDQLTNGSKETWDKVKETQIEVCSRSIVNADATAGKAIYEEVKRMILG